MFSFDLCAMNEQREYELMMESDYVPSAELFESDVHCIVQKEVFEPFCYFFIICTFAFLVMGALEPKKKK